MKIMQGSAGSIPFSTYVTDKPITPANADDIEIVIGPLRRTKAEGSLFFDEDLKAWLFPYSQEETMNLIGTQSVQVRVKYGANLVDGVLTESVTFTKSSSQVVL